MPHSADPQRTREAMQASLAALRDWRAANSAANDQHLQDLSNMDDPVARARAIEHVAGGVGPSAALGAVPKAVDWLAQKEMAGLLRARAKNTFSGQAEGAGRNVGFTQPPNTPTDKLFSNFADAGASSPEQFNNFRSAMLDRATSAPGGFPRGDVATTTTPFGDGLWARTDAGGRMGNTRVQVYNNKGETQAAARMDPNGMLDSIASGQGGTGVGKDLLSYLHENGLANIYEVPDRSPGFVNIQRAVIDALRSKQ